MKIQENQLTEKSFFCELIFLEMQNSFLRSRIVIIWPLNVFFKNIEKLDIKP